MIRNRLQRRHSWRLARQLNTKRRPLFSSALDRDLPAVIAYYRLYYGETQPRAMLLSRVIRSEQAGTFFLRQARAAVGDREFNVVVVHSCLNCNRSTLRQGINR